MEWLLEKALPHPLVLGLLTLLSVFFIANLLWKKTWEVHPNLPPRSMGYYGVGETLHVMVQGLEYFKKKAEKHGEIYKTHFIGKPTIRVCGGQNLKEIYSGENKTVAFQNPVTARTLLGPNFYGCLRGAEHHLARKVTLSALKTEQLEKYIPRVQNILTEHMNSWCTEDKILGAVKIEEAIFDVAWDIIIGSDVDKYERKYLHHKFKEYSNGMFTAAINFPGFPYRKALQAKAVIHNYIDKQIGSGENISKPSLLQYMVTDRTDISKPYTREELKDMATGLIFAGHDTTSSAAMSLLICLAREQGVREKIIDELKEKNLFDSDAVFTQPAISSLQYLNCVMKEVLRLYPPVGGGFRTVLKAFDIGGYHVPKDWSILAVVDDTHKNTTVFEDREKFIPERWLDPANSGNLDYNYVPFGGGIRICVGKEYAKLILRLFAILYVRSYSCEMLSTPEFIQAPTLVPKDKMPVIFKRI